MLRSVAVARIQRGLGFANRQSDNIVLALQEAQKELEQGKTLPKFLIQEFQGLLLLAGNNSVALPTGFLRINDQVKPYYIATGDTQNTYLPVVRDFSVGQERYYLGTAFSGAPRAFTVMKSSIQFYNTAADKNYTILWSYYKSAAVLDTDIENEWLTNAPNWLIGEAGWRMAQDLRDKDAVVIFDNLRKTGRDAAFREMVASEEASGQVMMGENL